MVLISRLPRWIAGTSVPWRNRLDPGCSRISNWLGAALSTSSLKRSSDFDRKSGGGAAVEKRSRILSWAPAGTATCDDGSQQPVR